jgi:hypothetical protein
MSTRAINNSTCPEEDARDRPVGVVRTHSLSCRRAKIRRSVGRSQFCPHRPSNDWLRSADNRECSGLFRTLCGCLECPGAASRLCLKAASYEFLVTIRRRFTILDSARCSTAVKFLINWCARRDLFAGGHPLIPRSRSGPPSLPLRRPTRPSGRVVELHGLYRPGPTFTGRA